MSLIHPIKESQTLTHAIGHDEKRHGLQRISIGGKILSHFNCQRQAKLCYYQRRFLKSIISFNQTGFEFIRSENVNVDNILQILSAAFKVWETYTCLTFRRVNNLKEADIEIKFER